MSPSIAKTLLHVATALMVGMVLMRHPTAADVDATVDANADADVVSQRLFDLAQQDHRNRGGGGGGGGGSGQSSSEDAAARPPLHIVRVPKCGSSSLSVVARQIARCPGQMGPCCRFPGHPKGSCPAEGMDCTELISGCTGHNPHMDSLLDPAGTTVRVTC